MAAEQVAEAHIDEFEELAPDVSNSARVSVDELASVPLTIGAELGRARMSVRDILALKPGSLVTLTKVAGESADVTVNGIVFLRGEVVVIGDVLHVRVTDVLDTNSPAERRRA